MLKNIILLCSFCVALVLNAQDASEIRNSTSVYGANAMSSFGSARYVGMAGAMGAIGGEISASNINPAGTGVYISGDFFVSMYFNSYKNTSTLNGKSVSYTKDITQIGQIGGVLSFPIGGKWKFVNVGFNYTEQDLDNYVETSDNHNIVENISSRLDTKTSDKARFNAHGYNRSGSLSKTNISVGANYENKMYLGFGLNLHSSDLYQADSYELVYDSDKKKTMYEKQYSPYDEFSSGTSLSAGIIFKTMQIFRFGVAIESPIWWNIEKEYTEYSKNSDNKVISQRYRDKDDFRSEARFTVSSAVIPSKNFAFNVDYSRGFSEPRYTGTLSGANRQLNRYFNNFHRGLSEFKLGAEYRNKILRLRGGYSIEENPYKKEQISSINNDGSISNIAYRDLYIGKRNTLGLGIGFDFTVFYLDIAYQNTVYEYSNPFYGGRYATDSNISSYIVENDNFIVSSVKGSRDNIFVTLGFKF